MPNLMDSDSINTASFKKHLPQMKKEQMRQLRENSAHQTENNIWQAPSQEDKACLGEINASELDDPMKLGHLHAKPGEPIWYIPHRDKAGTVAYLHNPLFLSLHVVRSFLLTFRIFVRRMSTATTQ